MTAPVRAPIAHRSVGSRGESRLFTGDVVRDDVQVTTAEPTRG